MMLRAAIVGCGRIGCAFDDDPKRRHVSTHARAYLQTEGFHLAALCDRDSEKLVHYGGKFGIAACYGDCRRMLEAERPVVLSICTYSDSHLQITRCAADAGVRAIFCEKPVAESLESAEEMIRICRERSVLLFVNHQRRFDPFHQSAAEFVHEGGLGRIQQVTCYYTAGITNTGTHLFDLLRLYLGDARWAEARKSVNSSGNTADPNFDGWLGFSNGTVASVQACDASAYAIFEVQLLGTEGKLRISSHGFNADFEFAKQSERYSGYRELCFADSPLPVRPSEELLLHGMAHIRDCLVGNATPISTGKDGRAALEMICAFTQSAHAGGSRVEMPLANKAIAVSSK